MRCRVCDHDNDPNLRFCTNCGEVLLSGALLPPEIGVLASYGRGWEQLWKHFIILFIIGVVVAIVTASSSLLSSAADAMGAGSGVFLGLWAGALSVLVNGPMTYGFWFTYLKAARDEPPDVSDAFQGFRDYWNVVLASVVVTIVVVIGFFFFIIPGIYLACKLSFTPFLVMDRQMRAIDAMKESWRMTRGQAAKVFLIFLLGIPIFCAGLVVLIFGAVISAMWIGLAHASLYHAVSAQDASEEAGG